jgi:hypothetical protein
MNPEKVKWSLAKWDSNATRRRPAPTFGSDTLVIRDLGRPDRCMIAPFESRVRRCDSDLGVRTGGRDKDLAHIVG